MTGPAADPWIPLRHDGRDRPYLLHVGAPGARSAPSGDGPGSLPLVVELHGRGIPPVMFDRWTGFSRLAEEAGFALAMPAAVGEIWNDGRFRGGRWRWVEAVDDVGYLLMLIDDACARLPIDPGRIYVVGMSNGAVMAGRLACEHADRFAGIVQVAGTVSAEVAATIRPRTPLPVMSIHGTADRFARYEGDSAHGLRARLYLRHPAGPALGVDAWAALLAAANGAADGPVIERPAPDVTIRRWKGPTSLSELAFYRIEGGGHTWPGVRAWSPPFLGRVCRSFDATRAAWEFLAAHRRG